MPKAGIYADRLLDTIAACIKECLADGDVHAVDRLVAALQSDPTWSPRDLARIERVLRRSVAQSARALHGRWVRPHTIADELGDAARALEQDRQWILEEVSAERRRG